LCTSASVAQSEDCLVLCELSAFFPFCQNLHRFPLSCRRNLPLCCLSEQDPEAAVSVSIWAWDHLEEEQGAGRALRGAQKTCTAFNRSLASAPPSHFHSASKARPTGESLCRVGNRGLRRQCRMDLRCVRVTARLAVPRPRSCIRVPVDAAGVLDACCTRI
jgi:hypothetical protein